MISLRSIIDLLPYYFKEQDTYKVNGKGLLERYLDIFGTYFDVQVVGDISTLDDVIDVDKTPEVCLGYLWEFLGSMPYANPKAIDSEKWKQYFNGFNSDSTIQSLSKLWLYRKDSDGDHYTLTTDQVRALVKYSIALFSIRGTRKFFEVLLRLYGFEAIISNGSTYPNITVEDDDDSDYYGTDSDYYGTDDDYAGSTDSLFDIKTESTKLDSEWLNLDTDTTDNHTNCTRIVNVNFRLKSSYVYNVSSNEFKRLQDRMFNLINMFLPIGTRPHIIWDNVNVGDGYEFKVTRSIEVYVNRTPINWESSDNVFVPSSDYPGWYRVYDRSSRYGTPARSFDWLPLKFMVKVKDTGGTPAFISDQPKKFVVAFNGNDYSDTEYEDGHIFTVKPGGGDNRYYPKFKISVLCEEDFDLTNGSLATFILASWMKEYNYTLFKHDNHEVDLELSSSNNYVSIRIQSATIRTYTNDANPGDDTFTPQQVVNNTTGEYLTLCENGTTLPDRGGNPVNYSSYEGRCIYVQHIFDPGIYEFVMLERPEYKIIIEVTRVDEVLNTLLVTGYLQNNVVDNEHPTCNIRLTSVSNLNFLKKISTRPLYVNDNGGNIWETILNGATGNSPANEVGNNQNKPYYSIHSDNIYGCNYTNRSLPINIALAYLTNPIHKDNQCLKITITEHLNIDHPNWYDKKIVTFYPVTGKIDAEEEIFSEDVDGEPVYTYRHGREVHGSGSSPIISQFSISNPSVDKFIGPVDGSLIDGYGTSVRYLGLLAGLAAITSGDPSDTSNTLYIDYEGLYDDEVLIKETTNPVTQYWNNGELIILDDPGHYRFYGVNNKFNNVISNYVDINVLSNRYNAHYYLEVEDGDKSDDESYMIRTLIANRPAAGATVNWGFDFCITVDKSIIEAKDILAIDPNAFDLEVLLYRGGNPNRGSFLSSYTATVEVLTDEINNVLPHYKVKGSITLTWDGTYSLNNNRPPGLYCVELHDKNNAWPNTQAYRVVDAYVIPQKFDGDLYFDVDVISKAWTSPAGQIYDIDPITGKYTWGWYKTYIDTTRDYQYSVKVARYDPAVGIPQFRLKLTNNTIGYTRVYMYKLVEDGRDWDSDAAYPKVLSPIVKSTTSNDGIDNPHWLDDAIPKDWGFPGAYNNDPNAGPVGWDYGKGDTGIEGYTGRWLFTGSVYQLDELITGPQEPGKYLFLVNQLEVDDKIINYAYLEVKEEIQYSLIVDPMLAILQGTAVGTKVEAISSAKFTKETLAVTVTQPNDVEGNTKYQVPYAFYAYQPGTYTFKLYRLESGSFENGQWTYLGLSAQFKVLTDSGISQEYLSWTWSDISDREVQVVTTSNDIDWIVTVQNE